MEQDSQQYIDAAKTGIELAHKTGVLNRLFGLFTSRQSIKQSEQEFNYRERALAAVQDNAVETLATLELTMQEALKILGPGFSLDDLDSVNPTWQRHWTSGASKVGVEDEDRHIWWGRLVAGEIQHPGTFSLRTLAAMDTLSTREAQLFSRLCEYVWNPSNPLLILPPDDSVHWKPDFAEAATLESIGLAKFDSLSGFTWGTPKNALQDKKTEQVPPLTPMIFGNEAFLVTGPVGTSITLRCGTLLLTDVGQQIYRLTTPSHPKKYRDEMAAEWRRSYTVHQLPVVRAQES